MAEPHELLVIGGTRFLGRAVVGVALARGHRVTVFHRGRSNPGLYDGVDGVRTVVGDRDGELSKLGDGRWNAVVDTSGYFPRVVRESAGFLAPKCDHYSFISSISVYDDAHLKPGFTESSPVVQIDDDTTEEVTGETYGPLKALCEQAAEAAMPGRVLNVRAGLIVGPYDDSDRFTYWVRRVARGGEVLAPDSPGVPAQFIDVRDLAEWIVTAGETGVTGTFNATGPEEPARMGDVLDTCREVSKSDATFTWAPEAFLLEQGVQPWMQLPLWVPDGSAMMTADISAAVEAGLSFRPLAGTVRDTLEWDRTRPQDAPMRAGLPPEREAEVLEAFHRSKAADG